MMPSAPRASHDAHVLIVGGGGTGGALAHDLALRGVARHARRARRVHVRDDRTSSRPAAQRRAVRGERSRVGGGMHRGEPDPPCDRTRIVRGERRAVRGDRRRRHGVPAELPRRVRGVRHPCGAAHPTAGPSHGADAEPAAEGRGACARRNDGRDADAHAVLRDREAQRRGAAEPRGGDGFAASRRRRERRRDTRPRDRTGRRDPCGRHRERDGTLVGAGRHHGRRRRPDPPVTRRPAGLARADVQHGDQSSPRVGRRRHRGTATRALDRGHEFLGRRRPRSTSASHRTMSPGCSRKDRS